MAIIFAGFLLYFPTLFNGFVWDDEELIVNNPLVHSFGNIPAFFSGSTFNSGGGVEGLSGLYYKPLMTTAFSIIYTLFGPNPAAFHFFQISLHLANTVLLYFLFSRILAPILLGKTPIPFFLALLFLVHPINTEAVVYIADYQDVMFLFFGLLAFLVLLNSCNQTDAIAKNWLQPVLIGGLILFSLLAKETGVVIAVIILGYLILFRRGKIKMYFLAVGASAVAYAFLRFEVAKIFFNKHGLTEITTMDLSGRLINIPAIIFAYLQSFVFPINLAINQQWVVKSINWPSFWQPLVIDLGFLSILSFLSYLIVKRKRELFKLWFFFFFWFLLALSFHLQIFPLDLTVSDRWFYLPFVGLLGMAGVVGGSGILGRLGRFAPVLKFSFLAIVAVLALRTMLRQFDWRDGLTLYSRDIRISRNAFDLENNLGVELFRAGRINEAKAHFQRSVELSPRWWTNWNNLGAVYEREGNATEAARLYRKAIDNGQYYLAFENYAGILIKLGRYQEAKEFLGKEALPRLPNNARLRTFYTFLLTNN